MPPSDGCGPPATSPPPTPVVKPVICDNLHPLITPQPYSKSKPIVPLSSESRVTALRNIAGVAPGPTGKRLRTAATTPAATGVAADVPPSTGKTPEPLK